MTIQIFKGDSNTFEQQQAALRDSLTSLPASEIGAPQPAGRWLIVGGGGFGREVYSWTQGQLRSTGQDFAVGFLDDNPVCIDPFPALKSLWVDRISTYMPRRGDQLLMAIADPVIKLDVAQRLIDRGASFATYVHPTAILADDAQIGAGSIICPLSVVCCNVRIGNFVSMNLGAIAGHDSMIGDGCTLSPHSNVAGKVELDRGVFLGCQTVILPKVRVGEFARIGAGSSVISHVRPHSTMLGVPAKRISWSKSQDAASQKAA